MPCRCGQEALSLSFLVVMVWILSVPSKVSCSEGWISSRWLCFRRLWEFLEGPGWRLMSLWWLQSAHWSFSVYLLPVCLEVGSFCHNQCSPGLQTEISEASLSPLCCFCLIACHSADSDVLILVMIIWLSHPVAEGLKQSDRRVLGTKSKSKKY